MTYLHQVVCEMNLVCAYHTVVYPVQHVCLSQSNILLSTSHNVYTWNLSQSKISLHYSYCCVFGVLYHSCVYVSWFCDHRAYIKLNNHAGSYDTLYLVGNSNSDVVTYWTMIRTHVVPDRHQYDGNTPITSYLVHTQLLYGILYTTTSRPNTNTSTITLHAELLFIWTACNIPWYQTLQRRHKITGNST